MKKILLIGLLLLAFLSGMVVQARTEGAAAGPLLLHNISSTPYKENISITTQGSVRRIYFRVLYEMLDDQTGQYSFEWHYFGVTLSEMPLPSWASNPPYTGALVVEHPYVQLPDDLQYLGSEGDDALYDIGEKAGIMRFGLGKK